MEKREVNPIERAALGLDEALDKRQGLYLCAASALCLLTFSGYSHAKIPWMDEVLTETIIRQRSLPEIWTALKAGFEADPPFLETIVHYLFQLLGDHIYLARLPAIFGFCLTCVCLSALVWKHTSALFGAAAFFFPYATGLPGRAMDARPYGMMIGFSALALLAWDKLGDEELSHRTAWRVAFTASLTAALFSHFFSIWVLAGLGAGELYRWIARRKIDWATPLCAAVALVPYVLSMPVVMAGNRLFEVKQGHFHGHVAIKDLFDFFGQQVATLPVAGALILLLAALALWGRQERKTEWKALAPGYQELLAAAAGFLLVPFAGYAAAIAVTKFFIGYYFLIVAFGVVLGVSLTLGALQYPLNRIAGLCLFIAMAGHGLFMSARGLSGFARRDPGYPNVQEMEKLTGETNPDIVVTAPAEFLPFYENSQSANLAYLFDGDKALRQIGSNTSEIIYRQLQPFTKAHIEPMEGYLATHSHYFLAVFGHGTSLDDWQFDYWLTRGRGRLSWLGNVGGVEIFRVEPGADRAR